MSNKITVINTDRNIDKNGNKRGLSNGITEFLSLYIDGELLDEKLFEHYQNHPEKDLYDSDWLVLQPTMIKAFEKSYDRPELIIETVPRRLRKYRLRNEKMHLNDYHDAQLVREKILPPENESAICPIFRCLQDCSFNCHQVVAEIHNYGTYVKWKRMGFLKSTRHPADDSIEYNLIWYPKFGELKFSIGNYIEMIDVFKNVEVVLL